MKIFADALQDKNPTVVKRLADQPSTEKDQRLAEAKRESLINGQVTGPLKAILLANYTYLRITAMATLKELLLKYEETHLNPTNRAIHLVCVPLIVTFTIGLGWGLSHYIYGNMVSAELFPFVNLGTLGMALALVYYFRKSVKLFAHMLVYSALSWWLLYSIDSAGQNVLIVSAVVWIVAWIGQFIGHHIEGAKPSFTEDLVYLLVGPAFVLEKIYRSMGRSLV